MILVTGANGLLGSYVCKKLVRQNHKVTILVRKNSDLSSLKNIIHKLTIITGDILVPENIYDKLDNVDTIIHCAGFISFKKIDKEKLIETNVLGTKHMINLAISKNIKYFIHISSIAALGKSKESHIINEKTKWNIDKNSTNYGVSKYKSELEIWRGVAEGLNAIILNPSVIISPININKSSGQLFKYVLDENIFYPTGILNYIDVRDVSDFIMLLLKNKTVNQQYILNGGNISYKKFFEEIGERLQKSKPSVRANKFLLKIALLLNWLISPFNKNKNLLTKESIKFSYNEKIFSNEKIKDNFNFTFTSLSKTLDWVCGIILKDHQSEIKR